MKKRELVWTTGGNVNWCRHCGKQYGGFSKEFKIEQPRDPAILLLGICLKEMKSLSLRDIYTPKFLTPLFTTAKTWKQPKGPSMNG